MLHNFQYYYVIALIFSMLKVNAKGIKDETLQIVTYVQSELMIYWKLAIFEL